MANRERTNRESEYTTYIKDAESKIKDGEIEEGKEIFEKLAGKLKELGHEREANAVLVHAGNFLREQNLWGAADQMYKSAGDLNAVAKLWDYVATIQGEVNGREMTDDVRRAAYERAAKAYMALGKEEEAKERYARAGKKAGGLEKISSTAAIIGILGGIFFLSNNLTGNVIADLSAKTTSLLGAGLLILGLVAGFFWVKYNKP